MKSIIYLASPYSHEREIVRITRANLARKKTAELLEEGFIIYSPIVHSHALAAHLPSNLRHSHEFWMSVDLPMLYVCAEIWVLTLDDWQLSRGVSAELEFAKANNKPIRYIAYDEATAELNKDFLKQAEKGV